MPESRVFRLVCRTLLSRQQFTCEFMYLTTRARLHFITVVCETNKYLSYLSACNLSTGKLIIATLLHSRTYRQTRGTAWLYSQRARNELQDSTLLVEVSYYVSLA